MIDSSDYLPVHSATYTAHADEDDEQDDEDDDSDDGPPPLWVIPYGHLILQVARAKSQITN